jgi:uncharacterized membrane protein YedE/YeeE
MRNTTPNRSIGLKTMSTDFTPWASLAGGTLIGLSAAALLLLSGRIAGITGFIRRALPPYEAARPLEAIAFLLGMIAAPIMYTAVTGAAVVQTVSDNLPLMFSAGFLVGFGSAIANGCTSGHGVCGIARLSPRSLAATTTFMAVAVLTVFLLRHLTGG